MILLFTGNGKGKTTAALGQMMRALGRDKSALMIQFIKGPWRSGEDEFAARYGIPEAKMTIKKMGLGFVGILGDKIPRAKHIEAAKVALEYFKAERAKGVWHLIVLDEVNNAVDLGLITAQEVVEAIKDYPDEKILMLTGRGATAEMIDAADLVTEVREVKHPWNEGKWAKYTVEF